MNDYFNNKYPEIADLRRKAKSRIPKFAFDYLEGGCMEEIGIRRNRSDIENVQLRSELLKPFEASDLSVALFKQTYSSPYGIAPVGLQGLMWPKSPEILAKAAAEKNIPYVLSTVSSSSLERIAEIAGGNAWFQLYNPTEADVREDLLARLKAAQYSVLVVTVDVPTYGYRPKEIKSGLSMPPKMTFANVLQMLLRPRWLIASAIAGVPEMETLKPYMPSKISGEQFEAFLDKAVMGKVDVDSLKGIRDRWPGPLVIKGLVNEVDVQAAISLGADGVVISNHGARQLDVGEAPVLPLQRISKKYGDKIKILMDSGLRNGSNIACALASGADFTFLGRPFVYGVGALANKGGIHTINALNLQLTQIMHQLRCNCVADLPQHLVENEERWNNHLA